MNATPAPTPADTFPRQFARTQRLSLGEPRNLTIDEANQRVLFLRSDTGSDPVHHLWCADLGTASTTKIVDADSVASNDADLPAAERARRERLREGAHGITSYHLDDDQRRAVFTIGGAMYVADLAGADAGRVPVRHIDAGGSVFDPRLSPDGTRVAYVDGAEFAVCDLDGTEVLRLASPDEPLVSWGSADFVAAEEMRRLNGFWWSPDSRSIAVCRNDESPVPVWHIADPANPANRPNEHRYPAAGTENPSVELHIVNVDHDDPVDAATRVVWDDTGFEYLPRVSWNEHGLVITVQSRDQRRIEVRSVDPATGATAPIWTDHDEQWVELVVGSPAIVGDGPGGVVATSEVGGVRRLVVAGEAVSPDGLQIRSIVAATATGVVVTANPVDRPTVLHLYEYRCDDASFTALATPDGVVTAAAGASTVAVKTATLERVGSRWELPSGATLESVSETPLVEPNVDIFAAGADELATAVLLPHDHDGGPLPVLLDPYGGPHAQRVVRSRQAMLSSQWFADQGFAVVITDGRGTPGRGSAFERAVRDDLASGVLDDQIAGLDAAAERFDFLNLERVAIRGWSFGGYLAALAVLRRPDRFHAAIAGAPVTEWRLYDTHYTERYLGDPRTQPDVYDKSSLLPDAAALTRPLLLIHGLADDNVVSAHTLQLSSALLAAGRYHEVLPLVGVSHMTPQEVVAENLLLHQLEFLRGALGLTTVEHDG